MIEQDGDPYPPVVGDDFTRGLRNGLIIGVIMWMPIIYFICWLVNR